MYPEEHALSGGHRAAQPPVVLKLLAQDLYWRVLAALARSDQRVEDLACVVERAPDVLAEPLAELHAQHLILARPSSVDDREIYYRLNLDRLRDLYTAAGVALHPALVGAAAPRWELEPEDERPLARVLFLCTYNAARSQMAEGLLRTLGRNRIAAYSAGVAPTSVHPLAVHAMAQAGIDISDQRTKHLCVLLGVPFDYVITLCDRLREICPSLPAGAESMHWSIPDPVTMESMDLEQQRAFSQTVQELTSRIRALIRLIEQEKGQQL